MKAPAIHSSASESELPPDPDALRELLNAEIDRISNQRTVNGWSMWAVLGSLAAVAWLLLETLEDGASFSIEVWTCVLVFFLCIDGIDSLKVALTLRPIMTIQPRRFRIFNVDLVGTRFAILVASSRFALLSFIAWKCSTDVPSFVAWITTIGYALLVLSGVTALACTWLPIPVGAVERKYAALLSPWWFLLPVAITYLVSLNADAVTIKNVRLAGLIGVGVLLVEMLANWTSVNPVIDRLVRLRRDLVLKRTDVATAAYQAEMALVGMTMNEALQEDISRLLRLSEAAVSERMAIDSELRAIEEMWPTLDQFDARLPAIEALLASSAAHQKRISELLAEFTNEFSVIEKLMLYMVRKGADKADIDKVMEKVHHTMNGFEEHRQQNMERTKEIEARIEELREAIRKQREVANVS